MISKRIIVLFFLVAPTLLGNTFSLTAMAANKCQNGGVYSIQDKRCIPKNSGGSGGSTNTNSGSSGSGINGNGCVDKNSGCIEPIQGCTSGGNCDLISNYVNPGIDLLAASFGAIAAGSIILGGIQYATSEGDPQKASGAKKRITNTLIALVAFIFLWAFLQFLIPGGLFNRPTG